MKLIKSARSIFSGSESHFGALSTWEHRPARICLGKWWEVEVGVSVVTDFPFSTQSTLTSAKYLLGFQPVSTS